MRVVVWVLCIVLFVAGGACRSARQDNGDNVDADQPGEPLAAMREVTGTIRYIDLEGGFYGIETDDGARLDPVNLPADFQKDGLRVRATVERLRDRISVHMWGTLVRITAIARL